MMNGKSKLAPSVLGTQYPGAMPCGKKMPVKRLFGLVAAWAKGVWAGSIASRNGKAKVTPAPRRKVRRERCFFWMNISIKPPYALTRDQQSHELFLDGCALSRLHFAAAHDCR